jgi:UDP-N-acetylglucosamine 4,6-dehydratase
MITAIDSFNTVDRGDYHAILPSAPLFTTEEYCAKTGGKRVPVGFAYDSGSNPDFLSVDQLPARLATHVTGKVID